MYVRGEGKKENSQIVTVFSVHKGRSYNPHRWLQVFKYIQSINEMDIGVCQPQNGNLTDQSILQCLRVSAEMLKA